jgi:hypothetical protein
MKESFKLLALALALTSTFAGVSASISAADASGTASATIVVPARTGNPLESVAVRTFFSGVTSDLTIHMPGLLQPAIRDQSLNPASFELSTAQDSGCSDTGVLADCLALKSERGLLQGDPVHDILVNLVTHGTSGEGSVSLTLGYN